MIVETKFNLGERVFPVWHGCEEIEKVCPFCGGSGKISGANAVVRSCPECYGEPVREYRALAWNVGRSFVIRKIEVERHSGKDQEHDRIIYMEGRSGQMYFEQHLFGSSAEAEDECARLNSEAIA